eukprot:s85_g24.t1
MKDERERQVSLHVPTSWNGNVRDPTPPPRASPTTNGIQSWMSPETFRRTPNGTRVPSGPPPPSPPPFPQWPPELSHYERVDEPPRKMRGLLGSREYHVGGGVCSPRTARHFWLEREVASLKERLEQEAVGSPLQGYWSKPFQSDVTRARDVQDAVSCMKRNAGIDGPVGAEVLPAFGDVCQADRASMAHVHGEPCLQDRANAALSHGAHLHQDRAGIAFEHGAHRHEDRARRAFEHGVHPQEGRARMASEHGVLHRGARASAAFDLGEHPLQGRAYVAPEQGPGDWRRSAYALGDHPLQGRALGDLRSAGLAPEQGPGELRTAGLAPEQSRGDAMRGDGLGASQMIGRTQSHGGGVRYERDVVEDGDLKSVPIQLPSLPSPEGRDSSLEAGDWLIQLEPLVGDLSKHASSWWRKIMDATTATYAQWLHADPLARLRIAAPENGSLSAGFERLDRRAKSHQG